MKNAIKIFLTFTMEMKRKSFHGILENLFAMSGSIISTLVFNNVDLKLRIHHFIYSVEILLRFCFWTSSVPDPSRGHSFFFFRHIGASPQTTRNGVSFFSPSLIEAMPLYQPFCCRVDSLPSQDVSTSVEPL